MQNELGAALLATVLTASACATLVVLAVWTRRKSALLASRFNGTVSITGDDIRFRYGGVDCAVRRTAGGGGLAGSGVVSILDLDMDRCDPLTITRPEAMKYVFVSTPVDHSILSGRSAQIMLAGANHKAVAAALSDPSRLALVEHVLQRHFSTLQVRNEYTITKRQTLLRLTGLPPNIYENPAVLESILDSLVILRQAIAASRCETRS